MADKYQREIVLDDALLKDMIQQKGELVEKGRAISRQMTELQNQIDKLTKDLGPLTAQVVKLKVSIFGRLEKLTKGRIGEYEIPITADVRNGKAVLIVSDALREFSDSFKTFNRFREPVPLKKDLAAKP